MTKGEGKGEVIDLKGLLARDEDFVRVAVEALAQTCCTSLACGLRHRVERDKLPKRSPGTEGAAVWGGGHGVCSPRAVFFSAHCFSPPL
jgi:hypothetical protein